MKLDAVFAPLDVEYCLYFYILMVFGFVVLVLAVVKFVYGLLLGKKKESLSDSVFILAHSVLFYFVNRLLYTMCNNSLQK
jgi:hypothetical protein